MIVKKLSNPQVLWIHKYQVPISTLTLDFSSNKT